jgi:plasmid stability protein
VANLTIKAIPDELHLRLKEAAEADGKSLNSYVLFLLRRGLDDVERRRLWSESLPALRAFVEGLPRLQSESVDLIREDRERGHRDEW